MDFSFQPSVELLPNGKTAVAFVPDSSTVFREDSRLDVRTLPNGMRFIPWGADNMMPYNIIIKIEDDEALVKLRLPNIGRYKAVAADLWGVPFADYLALDNLYTGYLQTQRNDLLRDIAAILYKSEKITLTDEEAISVFYWFASLKAYYQRRFPYLFSALEDSGNLLEDTGSTAQRLQTAIGN